MGTTALRKDPGIPACAASIENPSCASARGLMSPREAARRKLDGSFLSLLYPINEILKMITL